LKGATIVAREFGYLVGGSFGGRIMGHLGKLVGDKLLHRPAETPIDQRSPTQATLARDEAEDQVEICSSPYADS
jgi:hypothetical protein